MVKYDKKLSIIIPNYNNEKYLDRSIQYLLKQTYKNIEIIVVNDGSPGNSDEIVEKYQNIDSRVKYIKHEKNKGLFQARLTGADNATGDYIGFLDADDYGTIDFYRTLMTKAIETNSDIVSGNTIMEYDNGNKIIYNLFEFNFEELTGNECIKEYFKQKGLNFSWHTIWNKIYSMEIWKKARPHYNKIKTKLLMTEDFAFSTVLFYYSKKMTKVKNDGIFYCQHEKTSTSLKDISYHKVTNNLNDLITSFNFIENFLKEEKIYDEYKQEFKEWKRLYSNMHRGYIKNAKSLSTEEKEELQKKFDVFCKDTTIISNPDFFSSIQTYWNEDLEKIKQAITSDKIKYVSFDIFDTAVYRPLFNPTDLFKILDVEYRKKNRTGVDFSKIRISCEEQVRKKLLKTKEDINLNEIYEKIYTEYEIDKSILEELKEKECKLEIEFCYKRSTIFELYELALSTGKKVIFTSDMYLDNNTITKILNKNGYNDFFKLYISQEVGKAKTSSNIYNHILTELNIKPEELVHIGDNYQTDFLNSKKLKINSYYFPKAIDIMTSRNHCNELVQMLTNSMPFWYDTSSSMQFLGIRTMIAVVANKYFDNPFKSFNKDSDFNADPHLIGYYCLGMYMFGVSRWLISNTKGKYKTISFMSRDGYLPMKIYEEFEKIYKDLPKSKYLYISRKALIPVIINEKLDLYKLSEIFSYDNYSPKKMYKYLLSIFKFTDKDLQNVCKKNDIEYEQKFKTLSDFNKFIKILINNFYEEEKLKINREKIKEYYDEILEDKPAVFDVGYSGRPEYYISILCNKNIGTFFLNINQDEALEYKKRGSFELKTYFPAKPTLTGNAYELILSKMTASCIGYDCTKDKIKPIFENYKNDYQIEYIIDIMQKEAQNFTKDLLYYFKDYIDLLYYQDYYITLPFLAYLNSSKYLDKVPLSCINFEDDVRNEEKNRKMIDDMFKESYSKNQADIYNLLNINNNGLKINGNLNYNMVDLNMKSKPMRLIYYILYDRQTFRRRLGVIKHKFKKKK